jgi:hypothetical protein
VSLLHPAEKERRPFSSRDANDLRDSPDTPVQLTQTARLDYDDLHAESPELTNHRTVLEKHDDPLDAPASAFVDEVAEHQLAPAALLSQRHHNHDPDAIVAI